MVFRNSTLAALAVVVLTQAGAQTPAFNRVIGEVTAIDASAKQITLKTDSAGPATVNLDEKTLYLRVPPGEKDLKKAARITLSDISVGDRVLARSRVSAEGQPSPALSLMVMTKAELAQKQERDRTEWIKRGISGTIQDLNADTKEITVTMPSMGGQKTIVVEPAGGVQYRRYAPDSARFSDAKPSSFAELKRGDRVRVLGDRNEDGTRIKAEEIVSGSFRTVAGLIKTIDAAAGQITLNDLQTKKPVTIIVNSDATLRRVPPQMAAMLARISAGTPPPAAAGVSPSGGAGPRNFDPQRMLEHMPPLTIPDLKPGDAILVSSTTGADPSRVTAITLLAGVEALLTAAPKGNQPVGGNWNFGEIGLPQ